MRHFLRVFSFNFATILRILENSRRVLSIGGWLIKMFAGKAALGQFSFHVVQFATGRIGLVQKNVHGVVDESDESLLTHRKVNQVCQNDGKSLLPNMMSGFAFP